MKLKLGTIAGTPIILEPSLILFALVVVLIRGFQYGLTNAIDTGLFISALFFCVLLHEFGHMFAAKYFDVKTHSITLNFLGGIALIENAVSLLRKPRRVLVVWFAGPLVNMVIFGLCFGSLFLLKDYPMIADKVQFLQTLNLMLFGFNLLPVFPLDGSIMLYGLLTMMTTRLKSTRIVSLVGMIGGVLMVVGAIYLHAFVMAFIGAMSIWSSYNMPKNPAFTGVIV